MRSSYRIFGLFAVLFAATLSAFAQTPILEEPGYTPTLTFDVATIRPSAPPDANFHVSVTSPPTNSHFDTTNLPIKALIQIAYGFDAPIAGMPSWADNTFYNIQARSDAEADARLAKLTPNRVRLEKRNAIRMLLKDRFGLETHMETRPSNFFNLVIAKGGVKMTPSPTTPPSADGSPAPTPAADAQVHGSQHGLEFVGTNSPLRAITGALSAMVRAPIFDKTGLTGTYNYTLQFGGEWSANDPNSYPNIFTALQEQLGLKLESAHESIPNLIVDKINKPTEN